MTFKSNILLLCLAVAQLVSCQPKEVVSPSDKTRAGEWPAITKEAKPWTRWWWMGNAVDQKNIKQLLEQYASAGLGGVEIAPIYGAKGYEDRYLDFLSEEWLQMLHYTVKVADSLKMGVDLTQGTGWPFGGPFVDMEHAASRLVVQEFTYKGPGDFEGTLQYENQRNPELKAELLAVMAYGEDGSVEDITAEVTDEGQLNWSAEGTWEVKAIYNGKTGQKVKRAAPGGQGYTLDHYSKEAVEAYLTTFEEAFGDDIPGIRSFYNDSFEVYGANFTRTFLVEFEKRRGYDLKPYLPQLIGKADTEEAGRMKSDYRETIHELLLENFTEHWTDWAHDKGKLTKNQAHGSPGNLLDLYATVDIPECETFGSSYFPVPGLRRDSADIRNVDPDPIMLKFASSAGHLSGKNLVSCETFTWLGEHFKSSYSQMKPEVEQVFLAGINHIFYHGVTYSPEDVEFPGWLFYASLNLTQQNSLWPHFKSFNDYIARVQSVLQSGKPDNEIIMYWPVYDVWADTGDMFKMISVHHIDHWLHPTEFYKQSTRLMEKGYSIDFASDKMLAEANAANGYVLANEKAQPAKVLLVPEMKYLPVSSLKHMLRLAEEGATVIFQAKPESVPGLEGVAEKERELNALWESLEFDDQGIAETGKGKIIHQQDLLRTLEQQGVQGESLTDTGLKFIRRAVGDNKYYYLVNHTPEDVDQSISINTEAEQVVILDPQSGAKGLAESQKAEGKTQVRVQLAPGETLILKTISNGEEAKVAPWRYLAQKALEQTFEGPWDLEFTAGGPELPGPVRMDKVQPWTAMGDERANSFSGQAIYSSSFELEKQDGLEYILDLGKVYESAKVWINGKEAGYAWSIPFELRVTDVLKSGKNEIKIEVANLMANRVRDMDKKGKEWRNYHEINFVNINYKAFDASNWKVMPSGLGGPVVLRAFE